MPQHNSLDETCRCNPRRPPAWCGSSGPAATTPAGRSSRRCQTSSCPWSGGGAVRRRAGILDHHTQQTHTQQTHTHSRQTIWANWPESNWPKSNWPNSKKNWPEANWPKSSVLSQFGTLLIQVSSMLYRTVFPTRALRVGVRINIVQQERQDLQEIPMTPAIYVFGRRIRSVFYSMLNFGIFGPPPTFSAV